MIKHLISHAWKEATRSPVWAKNLATNIFLGFMALILLSYVLLAGIFMTKILEETFPSQDPVQVINGIIIYYFGFEFILRFFLQNVPVLFIQPYLHLPIKKGRILHFMLRKSQLSVFNLIAILLFVPFALIELSNHFDSVAVFGWVVTIIGISMSNHFMTILFKKKLNDYPNLIFALAGVFAVLMGLDYFNLVSFSTISSGLFLFILEQPVFAAVPVVLSFVLYRLNYNYLRNNTYPDEISTAKKRNKIAGDFAFLKRYGTIGQLIAVELKLILRHKRPRNTLFLSGMLLLYGLIFYPNPTYSEFDFIFLFVGVFVTGIFFLNHGQFLLSWESGSFDFVLIRRASFRQYLEAKYWMFVAASGIAFVVSLAYGYFGINIIYFNLAAFLFNIGINIFCVMWIAMYKPKKIDLNRGAAFNYEGVGAAQFLIVLPIMVLPYVFYAPFAFTGNHDIGIAVTGLVGLIGFMFRDKILEKLTLHFSKKRHEIAAGFRAQ